MYRIYSNSRCPFDLSHSFEMKAMSVSKDRRRAGVARRMTEESVRVARQEGFKRVKCEATSEFIIGSSKNKKW